MTDKLLIAIGNLTKPATVLIEKISEAVGALYKPYQITRVAKAEAEASLIQAETQIQITNLYQRTIHRFLEEEAKKQANIEAITQKAIPLLDEASAPQNVANDWITNFFDKSRIVADAEMQQLWARVLAGEANAPGAFARHTVNLLANLDKNDAELFMRLCGFGWDIGDIVPFVFDVHAEIYNQNGINFNSLAHLESLGFIQFNSVVGYQRLKLPKSITAYYYGKPVNLTLPADTDNKLQLGVVLLTRAGQQLAPVCGSTPIDGFFDFVCSKWGEQSLFPKREA